MKTKCYYFWCKQFFDYSLKTTNVFSAEVIKFFFFTFKYRKQSNKNEFKTKKNHKRLKVSIVFSNTVTKKKRS